MRPLQTFLKKERGNLPKEANLNAKRILTMRGDIKRELYREEEEEKKETKNEKAEVERETEKKTNAVYMRLRKLRSSDRAP